MFQHPGNRERGETLKQGPTRFRQADFRKASALGKLVPRACSAALLVAGVAAQPSLSNAAPQVETAAPLTIDRPASAAQAEGYRRAERVKPEAMGLQPIVLAQQNGFSVADVAGPPDKPLPLKINLPPENGDLFRVLMVRGLPEAFELTAGVSLDDAWALSPSEAPRVALVAPPDYAGEFSLEVLFIRGNGEAREQEIVDVRIGPDVEEDVADTSDPDPAKQPQAKESSISPELQKSMFERASRMMSGGDIAGARLILRYLAEQGSPGAAFAMGQSFDPGFLKDIYVRGGNPSDVEKARDWYRRAAEMGNAEARSRLSALQ